MGFNLKDIVGNIFHADEKEKATEQKKAVDLQQKVNNAFGTVDTYNPFLKKNGELFNPNLNYQQLLDNPNISQRAKNYISKATGLTPSAVVTQPVSRGTVDRPDTVIKPTQPIQRTSTPTTATKNSLVDSAHKYIGTPYVWGGESMSEGGMDCSGFVYNALKDAGYDVGRTTAQGYRSYGNTVSKSDLQPGDLIFYGKDGRASHIGIYIGDGKMIHSSGDDKNTKANPGKGVSVINVDYRKDFLEARRY